MAAAVSLPGLKSNISNDDSSAVHDRVKPIYSLITKIQLMCISNNAKEIERKKYTFGNYKATDQK